MSFEVFIDTTSSGGDGARMVADFPYNNISAGVISQPRLLSSAKNMFSTPGLSLALQQPNMDNQGDGTRVGENFEVSVGRRSRDEEHDTRSGSDNMDGASGDDQDAADNPPRKKRYNRHTPQQIQELEALFKESPHPDDKQRLELSRRLCLETRQVKFWFQNRRTQMKTQLERHENSLLRQEHDKLRAENLSIRDAMRNPMCSHCGGQAIMGDISIEEQQLRFENARLKDELNRVCLLAGKFLGRPASPLVPSMVPQIPNPGLELGVGSNGYGGFGGVPTTTLPLGLDFGGGGLGLGNPLSVPMPNDRPGAGLSGLGLNRSIFVELALAAMDELVKMAQTEEPLWIWSLEGGRDVLNQDEYLRSFPPIIGPKPAGFVSEASRETAMVIINSLALVETMMESNQWAEMFPCMIARTGTIEVISNGMGGTRNGALQLMNAELQMVSPLVPAREVTFIRFCKQLAEGVWGVVDVSVENIRETCLFVNCRRLPSGFVVQDMPNGYSKVTWVEHAEYDQGRVHQLYRPLLCAGMGFGAQRWVSALRRQCESLAIFMSSAGSPQDHTAISAGGRRSMLKLAQRMTANFCAGVSGSKVHKWSKFEGGNVGEDVGVMTRKSIDDPGEPSGVVLCASTSIWLPVTPQRLFDFLRDERLRSEWDILSNGGPMQEMAHIAKGQDHANCVSLLRAQAMGENQSSMLILQETCTDAAGSLVVYAPVDIPAMHLVMNGGDSAYVAVLPSGFAIVPDGPVPKGGGCSDSDRVGGSLLTVAFQILVNSLPTAKLTAESVETVSNLLSCTVQKIKAALQGEN